MGMWQGILQGMQLSEERKRLARKEQIEEEDRQFLREKYNQQLLDGRMKSILELRQKRAERAPNEAEYSSELLAVRNRLGDYYNTEEGKRWYNTLRLNPEIAKSILGSLEEAEKKAAESGIPRDFRGQQFAETFQLLSDYDGDPEILDRLVNNGGDIYEAILSGDIDITTQEGYMQALTGLTQPMPRRPTVALEVSPTAFKGLDVTRFERQRDVVDNRTVELAEERIAALTSEAENAETDTEREELTSEATKINLAIEDFETNPTRLREMFGVRAYQETLDEGYDFFGGAEENPYLKPYQILLQGQQESTPNTFNTEAEARVAYEQGIINPGDTIIVNGVERIVGGK